MAVIKIPNRCYSTLMKIILIEEDKRKAADLPGKNTFGSVICLMIKESGRALQIREIEEQKAAEQSQLFTNEDTLL